MPQLGSDIIGGQNGAGQNATNRHYGYRWLCQFDALLVKNFQVLLGRKLLLAAFVMILPVFVLLAELLRRQVAKSQGDAVGNLTELFGGTIFCVGAALIGAAELNMLVSEKQRKLTTAMRIAGLREGAYWCSYVVLFLSFSAVAALAALGVGHATPLRIFKNCNPLINLLGFYLLGLGMAGQACFMSSFVCRPNVVNITSFLVFLFVALTSFVFTPQGAIDEVYFQSAFDSVLMLLLPWLSYLKFFGMMAQKAVTADERFTWADLNTTGVRPEGDATKSAGFALAMLACSAAGYVPLAWYTSQVLGGELSKPAWFVLDPRYWGFSAESGAAAVGDTVAQERLISQRDQSIRVHKLSKSYKDTTAVNELSVEIKPNSIFCLLGHNGAGKTTLINCLTGQTNPTFGNAFVCGLDVQSEGASIQEIMGICPQHDRLWDELTAKQHLALFARFGGVSRSQLAAHAHTALSEFSLEDEADEAAGTFSGGMKRRLSLAIAAVGNPKVIYLDEPTTGMDPLHRRQAWTMIQRLRLNRIVVLTTHSMEEADNLADQIAIMSTGKMKALGTATFLKARYGRGFQVSIIAESPPVVSQIQDIVTSFIPKAEMICSSAGSLTVSLPTLNRSLPAFFREIESGKGKRLIKEWGISNTTLEEVFLRLCAQNEEVNAAGTTVAMDPSEMTAEEAVEFMNEFRWSEHANAPVFRAEEKNLRVAWKSPGSDKSTAAEGEVSLGVILTEKVSNSRVQQGTAAAPVAATADAGTIPPTATAVLPPMMTSGSQLYVAVPDGRIILLTVPPGLLPGDAMRFSIPDTDQQTRGTSATLGAGPTRAQRREVKVTTTGQVLGLLGKMATVQLQQKRDICCQLCLIITLAAASLLLSGALVVIPGPALNIGSLVLAPKLGVNATISSVAAPPVLGAYSPDETLFNVIIVGMITMFNMSKFVTVVVTEKQEKLYFLMRLQGLSRTSYYLAMWVYNALISNSFSGIYVAAGYFLNIEIFRAVNPFRWAVVLLVWAHAQTGVCLLVAALFRAPKLSGIITNLMVVGSVVSVAVVQIFLNEDWSWSLLSFPPLAHVRCLSLVLQNCDEFGPTVYPLPPVECLQPATWRIGFKSELGKALLFELLTSTLCGAVGIVLLAVIPNQFGQSEAPFVAQKLQQFMAFFQPSRNSDDSPSLQGKLLDHQAHAADSTTGERHTEPIDVGNERARVAEGQASEDMVLLQNLSLSYNFSLERVFLTAIGCHGKRLTPKLAVDDLTFGIARGECFGLLGPNGAGKTSTFNILSGLLLQTSGSARICGFDTATDMGSVHGHLGVCPQFDVVWPDLTVKGHLELFARLKGVQGPDIAGVVQEVAEQVRLDGDALYQSASKLSGGMMRRLSLGISIIGNPQVLFLDEPSTGLDPSTRRIVWEIIDEQRELGRCLVLTTHSMEEADTLCTRIGIMTGGRLRAIGTQLQLKQAHGDGFKLSLTLASDDGELDAAFLAEICPTARLVYSFAKTRTYVLPTADAQMSTVFEKLVGRAKDEGIREWGISQASLEEAFIRIAESDTTTGL